MNPSNYFHFLSVNSVPNIDHDIDTSHGGRSRDHIQNQQVASQKPRYKIAYLILAHKSKENLLEMLKHLYSKDAIFLIHIDGNYPEMYNDVRNSIDMDFEQNGNVYLVEKPFKLQW